MCSSVVFVRRGFNGVSFLRLCCWGAALAIQKGAGGFAGLSVRLRAVGLPWMPDVTEEDAGQSAAA